MCLCVVCVRVCCQFRRTIAILPTLTAFAVFSTVRFLFLFELIAKMKGIRHSQAGRHASYMYVCIYKVFIGSDEKLKINRRNEGGYEKKRYAERKKKMVKNKSSLCFTPL